MADLALPRPLAHQVGPLLDPARFKLWRWGRRSGKSRGSFLAAVAGHGPGSTWTKRHSPALPGVLQGGDVIWVAPDYPQSLTIWQEEVRPRFAGLPGIELSEQRRQVTIAGKGMLEVRSAEAIDGLRGKGARVLGFILDESAHWDLEYAWRSVILPILLDNGGWAIFNSSPNAGPDGNPEHRVPSFFNRLCQQVMDGERGDEWSHCHLTARSNPAIDTTAFQALVAEYPADSPQLAQEVEAKLLTGGAGLAFPEWNPEWHTLKANPPADWRWFAGMDWGYRSPGCVLLAASGPDREVWVRGELYFREQTPYQVGEAMAAMMSRMGQLPEWIAGDVAMWGVNDGVSIAEDVDRGMRSVLRDRTPGMIPAPSGRGSRVTGWSVVHEALRYDPSNVTDGTLAPFHQPRLRVHTDCTNLIRTLPALPRDEKNPEEVNTEAEDHAADALRYLLTSRVPEVAHREPGFSRDKSRGWHPDGTPRRPEVPGFDEEHERGLMQEASGKFLTGIRWGE